MLLSVKCRQTCSAAFCSPWPLHCRDTFLQSKVPKPSWGIKESRKKTVGQTASYRRTRYYYTSVRQKWSRVSTVIKQGHLLFGTNTKILRPMFLHGRTLTGSSCDLRKSKAYLCSTALLRRSFSVFSTAASGLT